MNQHLTINKAIDWESECKKIDAKYKPKTLQEEIRYKAIPNSEIEVIDGEKCLVIQSKMNKL